MPDGTEATQRIKRGRKFDQVIAAGRRMFMDGGFERVSVDEIAREAGVSKATLYSYFPDKRLLFVEVMKAEAEDRARALMAAEGLDTPPETFLYGAAREIIDIVLSDFGVNFYRMSVTEGAHFSALARVFYESGPEAGHAVFVPYFEAAEARGELSIPNKVLATEQFFELSKAWLHPRRIMEVQTAFTEAEKDEVAREAVAMFLARYGTG
ncbi:MAG: TetR/AcrR family transcriptional regulator [Shimia sp.]